MTARGGDRTRRSEILDTAAFMFATSGIRTSLKEIADACGILPGSLYHHFESKEAIVVELVEQFHAELDDVVAAALEEGRRDPSPDEAIIAFGTAIAACAVRHRAALLLSSFEPPAGAGGELRRAVSEMPKAIDAAMAELLRSAQGRGRIRRGLDLDVVADRICQSMLHVGIGVYHRTRGAERVPELKCRIILDGLVDPSPAADQVGCSDAHRVANDVITEWREAASEHDERADAIRTVARSEFAKRGVEATTMRDIAATAGVNTATMYRAVSSKDELIELIMRAYTSSVTEGWDRVLRSRASPLEKLDALLWLDINVLDCFSEEHRIQTLALQQAPPKSANLPRSFPGQLRQIRQLLTDGDGTGQFRFFDFPPDMRARATFSLVWTPENLVRDLGTKQALELARDTVLRGVAVLPS